MSDQSPEMPDARAAAPSEAGNGGAEGVGEGVTTPDPAALLAEMRRTQGPDATSVPTTKWWLVGAGVALVIMALFTAPLLWLHHSTGGGGGVISDLGQFSKFQQGQSADQSAVSRVERDATRTVSGGMTVWAEKSGNTCWGVVVSNGTASSVQAQPASFCR